MGGDPGTWEGNKGGNCAVEKQSATRKKTGPRSQEHIRARKKRIGRQTVETPVTAGFKKRNAGGGKGAKAR